ncbi:MAG: AmmeMemoRadiSam system radical SAM enzyme [Firmicutes bacterium]|nr:AmmeMemoRadiSam system radical SAM enzyme [Bacillota bacterium]
MQTRRSFIKTLCASAAACSSGFLFSGCTQEADAGVVLTEAQYYVKESGNTVRCQLCPRGCRLSDGSTGACRVRKNSNGKLYSLVYGKPVSIHIDPIEKKPFYHFLPGAKAFSLATAGCNLRCSFCQNWEISQADPDSIPAYDGQPGDMAKKAEEAGTPVITCTYTEPAIFIEYAKDIAAEAKKRKIRTTIVSAGFINEKPLKELCKCVSAIKIDLKAFDDSFYRDLTGGRLEPVKKALVTIRNSGVWLEIVNLVIPGKNDNIDKIKEMCVWVKKELGENTPVHFTRFIPMYKMRNVPPTPGKTLEQARKTGLETGLKYVYVGNLPGHPGNSTYCPSCGRVVIERTGFNIDRKNLVNGRCGSCKTAIAGIWK